MAFQNLRPGSKIYIFHKNNQALFEIGQVVGEVKLTDKYPTPQQSPFPSFPNYNPAVKEQVVSITVKLEDGRSIPISDLVPTADIEDCGNGTLVSCSKEAINAEIIAHKQISDAALSEETLSMHRTISKNCEENLAKLNPEIAERAAAEKENQELRKEVKELRDMLSTFMTQLGVGGPQNK